MRSDTETGGHMKQILLHPNSSKQGILENCHRVFDALTACGAQVVALDEDLLFFEGKSPSAILSCAEAVRRADIAVILGGDGTLLHFAQTAAQADLPLLGINMGHIGFMTELERDELGYLRDVVDGRYTIDKRMMLDVTITDVKGKTRFLGAALNDAVVAKGSLFRVVELNVSADGQNMITYSGDGIVIATPTGSTAYSMSAGGPIVEPEASNLIITPICAHGMYAKSYVLSDHRVIRVTAKKPDEKPVYVSVDGGESCSLLEGDTLCIRKSDLKTSLIRVKGRNFYDILSDKLSERRKRK